MFHVKPAVALGNQPHGTMLDISDEMRGSEYLHVLKSRTAGILKRRPVYPWTVQIQSQKRAVAAENRLNI